MCNYEAHTQGDPLFNIAEVDQDGTRFNKMTEVLAYADPIVLIGRSLLSVKEELLKLDEEGLRVNEGKTKVLGPGRKRRVHYVFVDYCFEAVSSFQYLSSQ